MVKRRVKKLETSWVDVGEEDDESEDLSASATSFGTATKSSTHFVSTPKRRGLRSSSLIMPKVEREVSTPKPRKRRQESIQVVQAPRPQVPRAQEQPNNYARHARHAGNVSASAFGWVLDILLGGLQILKTPLTYAFACYMFIGLMMVVSNAVTNKISTALSPVCRIPGASMIVPSFCANPVKLNFSGSATPEPEFDHLMEVQRHFEHLLYQSVDYYAVPTFMKLSQSAMRDVREVVRYSHIKSKNELILEFDTFISAASQASWDLETFNSHIGRTVDRIMLTNRWTQRTLDQIAGPNITRGAIGMLMDTVLAPFQPVQYTEDAVLDLYIQQSDETQKEISELLTEAQIVFALLRALEESVDAIHGITARDTEYAQVARDEILATMWSKLGGNRKQRKMFESQLKVLKQVSAYGKTAYANIAGAVLKLQTMSAEIDQLRERMMSVDPTLDRQKLPLSVHLQNVQLGLQRLEEARAYARDGRQQKSRQAMEKGREVFGDLPQGDFASPLVIEGKT